MTTQRSPEPGRKSSELPQTNQSGEFGGEGEGSGGESGQRGRSQGYGSDGAESGGRGSEGEGGFQEAE